MLPSPSMALPNGVQSFFALSCSTRMTTYVIPFIPFRSRWTRALFLALTLHRYLLLFNPFCDYITVVVRNKKGVITKIVMKSCSLCWKFVVYVTSQSQLGVLSILNTQRWCRSAEYGRNQHDSFRFHKIWSKCRESPIPGYPYVKKVSTWASERL